MSEKTPSSDQTDKIPAWRRDLPTEWATDNYTTRREFTKFLVLTSGGTFVGNGFFVLQKARGHQRNYPQTQVAAVGDLPVGSVKLFRYPTENDPAILLRLTEEKYVAFAQRCTHLSCPVFYDSDHPDGPRLECPCHDGAFDAATGAVLEGPPPRGLPRISLRIQDGAILACGIELS